VARQRSSRALGAGVHSAAWKHTQAGFSGRAVLFYLWNQLEQGTACPVTMTFASIPVMRHAPDIERQWRAKVLADAYDPRPIPVDEKTGATIGMAMTEKQGGSDLRQVRTEATRGDGAWRLEGHKWFCSAPMSDAFFTLALLPEGVTCFFVPRSLDDGSRNPFLIQRLKDKCGNRSNASSEIEYRDTWALLVGEEGRGIREILSHAHLTRLDFAAGSAGLMRQALTLALSHAQSRGGFGRPMAELPMQANVLADLALESEAAMLGALRVAAATDRLESDEAERLFARVATPTMKFWNGLRAPGFVYECVQVHGGNGFVLENPVARLYREAPLNSIWEGTSNMMCMDVLRALQREPGCRDAFLGELGRARGRHAVFDRALDDLGARLDAAPEGDGHARSLVSRMAVVLQAGQMLEHSPQPVADLYVRSRLGGEWMHVYGTLPDSADIAAVVARAAVVRH